jgi:hypothetical protein
MKNLRKYQSLVREGFCPVFIAANRGMTSFCLLAVDKDQSREEISRNLRGMTVFIGVAAIVEGRPRTALNVPLEADAIATLSQAVVSYFTGRVLACVETPSSLGSVS